MATYKQLVNEALEKAAVIRNSRNVMYNSGVDIRDYWTFGMQSIVHEIAKKSKRMISLLNADAPMGELEDSLLDIINYAAFGYAEIHYENTETKSS